MGFSKPPGVPCPPRNPHCNGNDLPDMPIDNWICILIVIILIIIYTFYIMKPKVKITVDEFVKIHTIDQEVKKMSLFYKVSTFLWGEKPFRWGELKGL